MSCLLHFFYSLNLATLLYFYLHKGTARSMKQKFVLFLLTSLSKSSKHTSSKLSLQNTLTLTSTVNPVQFLYIHVYILRFYLFLERGKGREKEQERNISVWLPLMCPLLGTWPVIQACAPPGNPTGDPLVLRPALNPLSHTSQGVV